MNKRMELAVGVAGWYKLEVVRPGGERRVLADWFPNLITNAGLDMIGLDSGGYLAECSVGSGNTAPANGDTALVALIASTTTQQDSQGTAQPSSTYYGARTNVYRFAQGVATGNIAEVGVGIASGNLFSRALVLNGGGTPTTITVLSDEVLDVTYQLRTYPAVVDVTGNRTIDGNVTAYTFRAAQVTSAAEWSNTASGAGTVFDRCTVYNGTIGAITSSPGGSESFTTFSGVAASYTPGTYFRDVTASIGLNDGNLTSGISAALVRWSGLAEFQVGLGTDITKTSSDLLSLTFRITWARKTLP